MQVELLDLNPSGLSRRNSCLSRILSKMLMSSFSGIYTITTVKVLVWGQAKEVELSLEM